ncbi:hypothetical protein M407DRAFT_26800 [Tulasnella calospora MUT 4182]|uniref:WW domain-containing protein n=1 Tax=Tulasnella calospora MUT 4182 TaxID=1051891 RepID=A0A0C3LQM7_9AGAM|nr:hypothetical protein M407DRAFT_26800 [Tulasnella calospora MUT 4182]
MVSSNNSSQALGTFVLRLRPTPPSHLDKFSGPLGNQIPINLERVVPPLSLVAESSRSGNESELGWTEFTHPDGNRYYWHEEMKIVTSNDPRTAYFDSVLRAARRSIEDSAQAQNADIQNAEAFLLVAAIRRDAVDINYYMVDHVKSIPFWLQAASVDRELLGIEPYESGDHLLLALRTEYWTHLESYPSHRAVTESAVDELTCLLLHSGIGARLDRLQGLDAFVTGQLKPSIVLSIIELLCFNLPKRTFYQLSELWNGRLVYIRHWDRFLREYRGMCLRMACVSGGIIWVMDSLTTLLLSSKSLNSEVVAAALLGSIALFTSLFLYERHSNTRLGTAMDVSAYVSRGESFQHGLRPLSIILSLPQALTIWAGLLFQIGLIGLVKTSDEYRTEAANPLAWIVPPVVASLVLLTAGSGWM